MQIRSASAAPSPSPAPTPIPAAPSWVTAGRDAYVPDSGQLNAFYQRESGHVVFSDAANPGCEDVLRHEAQNLGADTVGWAVAHASVEKGTLHVYDPQQLAGEWNIAR